MYDSKTAYLTVSNEAKRGNSTHPGVQFWGRLNQLFTNFKTDDCAEVIDNTISLSTAKWKYKTKVTKFFKTHILYSPQIEHLPMHCKICCFMVGRSCLPSNSLPTLKTPARIENTVE